jgi:REP element-mobilizing transposase RayT
MLLQPYNVNELRFAYCYRLYLRFRTHSCRPYQQLSRLNQSEFAFLLEAYKIHLLEFATNDTDVLTTLSLQPAETPSAAISKVKGRTSKWLREALQLTEATNLLSKGYFTCTVGTSTREAIERYLDSQSRHHGYAQRPLAPVFTAQYELAGADIERLSPKHGVAILQFHLVITTSGRKRCPWLERGRADSGRMAQTAS